MPGEVTSLILNAMRTADLNAMEELLNNLISMQTAQKAVDAMEELLETENGGYLCLSAYLAATAHTKEIYQTKHIGDDIFFATMACFQRFTLEYQEKFGVWGYDNVKWAHRQINGLLFRCGRLEYEFFQFPKDNIKLDDIVLHCCDDVLSVHIPSGGSLTHQECRESYRLAKEFFSIYDPGYHPKAFYCYSWLMCPTIKEILPPESNIVRFQNDYLIFDRDINSNDMLSRVFGKLQEHLDDYKTDTSLQRAVVRALKNNMAFSTAYGVFKY